MHVVIPALGYLLCFLVQLERAPTWRWVVQIRKAVPFTSLDGMKRFQTSNLSIITRRHIVELAKLYISWITEITRPNDWLALLGLFSTIQKNLEHGGWNSITCWPCVSDQASQLFSTKGYAGYHIYKSANTYPTKSQSRLFNKARSMLIKLNEVTSTQYYRNERRKWSLDANLNSTRLLPSLG